MHSQLARLPLQLLPVKVWEQCPERLHFSSTVSQRSSVCDCISFSMRLLTESAQGLQHASTIICCTLSIMTDVVGQLKYTRGTEGL